MTLPQELVDQMLSGYLDDALSSDEVARVEQLLKSDPRVASQLEELRLNRQSLRQIAADDRAIRLDKGFADRVLELAVARARAEGLSEDHPLIRVSEQPTSIRSRSAAWPWTRVASVGLAAAASIGLAVFVLDSDQGERPGDALTLADADSALADPDPPIDQGPASAAPSEPVLLADGSPNADSSTGSDPGMAVGPASEALDDSGESAAVSDRIAASGNPTSKDITDKDITSGDITDQDAAPMLGSGGDLQLADQPKNDPIGPNLGLVMVLDVVQTDQGRASGAVSRALKRALIDPSDRKEVDGQIAQATVAAVGPDDEERVSVIYLETSARALERLHLILLDDEGIQSANLATTFDGPLAKSLSSVRLDPTTVRHQEGEIYWLEAGPLASKLRSQAGGVLKVVPKNDMTGYKPDSGVDFATTALILVR